MKFPESQELLRRIESFLEYALPLYVKEGKKPADDRHWLHRRQAPFYHFCPQDRGEYCTKLGYQPSVQHRDARRTA